ncbi:MAG: hypothetical protein IPL65_16245 [Lewinellaceae bacterium]|nr:hypothetical protein [Lewinellaceae bacterium]
MFFVKFIVAFVFCCQIKIGALDRAPNTKTAGMVLSINRNFKGLHGVKLAVFAERVIRMTGESPYLQCPETLRINAGTALEHLSKVMADSSLKRKIRTDAIRLAEKPLVESLLLLANCVEQSAQCKSDINTTGFRPSAEQRKLVGSL